jgi:hypothetical protein
VNWLSPLWVLILVGLFFSGRRQRQKAMAKAETVEGVYLPVSFRWRPTTYVALGLLAGSLLIASLLSHVGTGIRYAIGYAGMALSAAVFWLGRRRGTTLGP